MKRIMYGGLLALAAALGSFGWSAPLRAQSEGTLDAGSYAHNGAISAAAVVGLGIGFTDTVADINPLGLGLGAKAGYHLQRIYLGGRGEYYLGGSSHLPTGDLSMRSWTLGVEGGYDVSVAMLVVRPSLVLGVAGIAIEGPPAFIAPGHGAIAGASSRTSIDFSASPGATVLLPLGPIFVGAELRVPLIVRDGLESGVSVFGTAGMSFST